MGVLARERPADGPGRYRLTIEHIADSAEPHWVARVDGLPGCVGGGATPTAAVAAADAAANLLAGPAAFSHSGRLLLRLPKILHAELAGLADAAQLSLNQLIVGALADTVGGAAPSASESPAAVPSRRLRNAVRLLLAADALVVALVLAAALLILVGAWSPG
jgi:predicted RNase H-like HicB family nuclease